jgi:molybdenum cofactor cytidylyltransferase
MISMIGILLAAGFSRRFGSSDKLLQALPDGRPIAVASAQNLIEAMPTSVAVVRAENTQLAELLLTAGFNVVSCEEDKQEMADSLAMAIRFSSKFEAAKDGFVVALADMPYIQAATISVVAKQLINSANHSIVIPTYDGQRGHPVGFAAKYRSELENLHGDEGARAIIKRYPDAIYMLPCKDAGILADIDTPADVKR